MTSPSKRHSRSSSHRRGPETVLQKDIVERLTEIVNSLNWVDGHTDPWTDEEALMECAEWLRDIETKAKSLGDSMRFALNKEGA